MRGREDSRIVAASSKRRQLAHIILLLAVWVVAVSLLHGEMYQPVLDSFFPASTAFLFFIVISFTTIGGFSIGFILLLVRVNGVRDARSYFKIERLDVRGLGILFALATLDQIINALFLFQFLLKPAMNFLASLGLSGAPIGLGSGGIVPQLSPLQAAFLTIFLLVFWWIEVPEELFFRGYIQNKLQGIVGMNAAVILSALIWDFAHVFGLVTIVERFFYGLIYAVVFRIRQNTTPTMIFHPISNRATLLAVTLPAIWGVTLSLSTSILLTLSILVVLLLAVVGFWRILRLDRRPQTQASESTR